MKKIVLALAALVPVSLSAADAQAPAPVIPAELALQVERKVTQSLSLQLQLEQVRRDYEQLVQKMKQACSDKGFTLDRNKTGDWVCIAPMHPATPK
jgi:Skp family chaperone for outer membrane proteins